MTENRREKRTEIKNTVTVLNDENGYDLGILVNISPQGLGIKGEVEHHIGDEFEMILILDKAIFGAKRIFVDAKCVWTRADTDSSSYLSGFEFTHVSSEDANIILGFIMEQDSD